MRSTRDFRADWIQSTAKHRPSAKFSGIMAGHASQTGGLQQEHGWTASLNLSEVTKSDAPVTPRTSLPSPLTMPAVSVWSSPATPFQLQHRLGRPHLAVALQFHVVPLLEHLDIHALQFDVVRLLEHLDKILLRPFGDNTFQSNAT